MIISETLADGWEPVIFGYAGGLQERDTGLIRFGARDYDPEVGRWTSKEPLGFNGSDNFYVYANNDPINFVDVNGLWAVTISFYAKYGATIKFGSKNGVDFFSLERLGVGLGIGVIFEPKGGPRSEPNVNHLVEKDSKVCETTWGGFSVETGTGLALIYSASANAGYAAGGVIEGSNGKISSLDYYNGNTSGVSHGLTGTVGFSIGVSVGMDMGHAFTRQK
jgi:RHS repeat-associated protein